MYNDTVWIAKGVHAFKIIYGVTTIFGKGLKKKKLKQKEKKIKNLYF